MNLARISSTLLVAPVVLLAAGVAAAFLDTHLDEIAQPLDDHAAARLLELEQLESPTKAEKKERKLLTKLRKKLARPAKKLANDFAELRLGTKTARKLGEAAEPMLDELDEAFRRAELALDEREEFTADHVDELTAGKARTGIEKLILKYEAQRDAADAELDLDRRAKLLQKAEKDLTKALKKAEKAVLKAGRPLPLIRLRSGDRVGSAGARIVIRDLESPLFGSFVEIPSGALRTSNTVTLEAGNDIVTEPDTPAGPALAVLPRSLTFEKDVEVGVRFARDPGEADDLLGVYDASGVTLTRTELPGNVMSRATRAGGDFQAGYVTPPPGTPSGLFRVSFLTQFTNSDATDADRNATLVELVQQDFRFRVDGTMSLAFGPLQQLSRTYLSDDALVPHHFDFANSRSPRTGDFEWETESPGSFTFSFDEPALGATIEAQARLAEDGDTFVFVGHGGPVDVIGMGVRAGTDLGTADLEGRYAYASLGMDLLQPSSEPFTTRRRVNSGTILIDDAGAMTIDAGGTQAFTDQVFDSAGSPIEQRRTTGRGADGGSATLTAQLDGSVRGSELLFGGQLSADGDVLLLSRRAPSGSTLELIVALRQPTPSIGNPLSGTFRTVSLGVGVEIDEDDSLIGTTLVDVATGTLELPSVDAGTYTTVAGTRNRHTLTMGGTPNLLTWVGRTEQVVFPSDQEALALDIDDAGNFRPVDGIHWFSASGDGRFVVGISPGTSEFESRTLILGVR